MSTFLTVTIKHYYHLFKKNIENIVPFCYAWYYFKAVDHNAD